MIRNEYKINTICIVVLAGFVLSVFYHYTLGSYFNLSYPYNTFLFSPNDRFNDFFNMVEIVKDRSPYNSNFWFNSCYFPAANSIFYLFSLIPGRWLSFMLFEMIFLVFFAFFIKEMLKNKSAKENFPTQFVIMNFLTYPYLFNLDRGNIEIYVFIFVALFFYFYYKQKFLLSILFLSLAISMKLYPGVFIFIILKDKKYKEIILLLLFCTVFTILSFLGFKGGIIENIKLLLLELKKFNITYGNLNGIKFNASYYGSIKLIIYAVLSIFFRKSPVEIKDMHIDSLISLPYMVFVMILFLIVVILSLKKIKSNWKIITLLCFCSILFTNVSFDYKLIFVFIPLYYYLMENNDGNYNIHYSILFGLLLIPKDYIIIYSDISIAVLLNPLLMSIIGWLIIYEDFKVKRVNNL